MMAGYQQFRLLGDGIWKLRDRLSAYIGELETFNPESLTSLNVTLTRWLHQMDEWKQIVKDNADFLREVAGANLLYQREPYLRIARPGKYEDNLGIHRDTHYGATSDEWVLWIPITHAISGGELRILPGSHRMPDDYYPWTRADNPEVEKGGDKHWLGFRYAPKKMSAETEAACAPVPCKIGEAILFNAACVHGQIVNKAPWTRFSIDIRLVDESAPIQHERGLRGQIYEKL